MLHADFVPLHLHTEYSLLDGAIKIEDLVRQAALYKMPAVAITDHGNVFGAIDFYQKARKAGIKPIIGCEIYVAPQSRFDRVKSTIDADLPDEAAFHLVLLARNMDGYRNLTTLVTKAYLEGFYYKPRIDKDLLEQYSGGLIGLSACLKGEVPYFLLHGQIDRAREAALHYRRILGPKNFYLELQDNGLPEQNDVNAKLRELSAELHIPLVATNDCHYLHRDDMKAHEILMCIQTGKTVKDDKRLRFETDQCYFKSPEEMKEAFKDIPEAIANTIAIAERCNLDIALNRNLLPHYELPKGQTPDAYLKDLAFKGLAARFAGSPPPQYLDRLKMELDVITKTGYASYFLIVWDFISYAKTKGIPVGPGRGSAAGSLVAYSLGITEIDPIKYKLFFERFLNPERVSMPDIDVDFCMDRRQEVISYVTDKYGKDRVAQIITFGTMKAKAAIRDVGRALDIPYAEVDRIAKLVPSGPEVKNLSDVIRKEPQIKDLYDTNPAVRELLDIAIKLEGIARHASTHAAGIVIAPEPLNDFVALYKQPAEETITTQCDMKAVEKIGLLKFDFLGLKTLTVLNKTVEFLRQQGKDLVLTDIPMDDAETYRFLSSGETTGIFQLESAGMRDVLVRMQPNKFEDLIALVALYRPGPMNWIDDFIKKKKGELSITYPLPQLKEILDETYGIILYQEQVMMIAQKVANFSMGQADFLRKAMGKKIPEEMDRQKEGFIKGAIANGIPQRIAEDYFEEMAPFAGYGFNKSHSAAYAYIAYQTAYLKTHYPVEFMTANLSADMGDTDKVVKLLQECRSMSIDILPPDINESVREFRIAGSSVRFGLEAVKGVGFSAIEVLLAERDKGRFTSLDDFMSRVDTRKVNKKVAECLIKAGAFDSLYKEGPHTARATALEAIGSNGHNGQAGPSLFGDSLGSQATATAWDEITLLGYEKDSLGFYLSGHPLSRYRRTLTSMTVATVASLEEREDRAEVSIAGVVSEVKTRAREKGITAYLTIEDETGRTEAFVFNDVYTRHSDLLKKGSLLIVRGHVARSDKGAKLIARELTDLGTVEIRLNYEVDLRCDNLDGAKLKSIRNLLSTPVRGQGVSLSFRLHHSDGCVVIATILQPGTNFVSEMKRITGAEVHVQ